MHRFGKCTPKDEECKAGHDACSSGELFKTNSMLHLLMIIASFKKQHILKDFAI